LLFSIHQGEYSTIFCYLSYTQGNTAYRKQI
jgi:hypothetical protein